MQLQERFPEKLVVLTLNVDFDEEDGSPPTELMERISDTLKSADARCVNLICGSPMEEVLAKFEVFSLPAAMLFDGTGQLLKKFDGKVDVEGDLTATISKLSTDAK